MADEIEAPFTPEQIAWLDDRYRKGTLQLERELQAREAEPAAPAEVTEEGAGEPASGAG